MSNVTTASLKQFFRIACRLSDAAVGRKMMDGQRPRMGIPAHARADHSGLLQKRLEEDLC